MALYALLAPHLGNSGEHNNARAADDLTAWKDDNALCLLSDSGFSRSSAGYVGASDGWQDFSRNGRMTWEYGEAIDGNVALLGELAATQGTLEPERRMSLDTPEIHRRLAAVGENSRHSG